MGAWLSFIEECLYKPQDFSNSVPSDILDQRGVTWPLYPVKYSEKTKFIILV